jgi:hypothetical protein
VGGFQSLKHRDHIRDFPKPIGHAAIYDYAARITPGGCQVPLPAGRMEGGDSFGQ